MVHPPPTLPALVEHLGALMSSPMTTELDVRLVETFTAQLTDDAILPLIPTLVPQISGSLQFLRTDPTPLTTLLLRLLHPVSFLAILPLTNQDTILEALGSPSPPIQHLGLSLLEKAAASASEASIVASWIDVVKKLVTLALVDQDTGVSSKASTVLLALLNVDSARSGGTGLVWRRIFEDTAVYSIFYSISSWSGLDLGSQRRKTEAQGRLLSLLPELAELDFEVVAHSRHADIEKPHQPDGGAGGLLAFAARHMVREKEDVMLHMVLIDFYTKLLAIGDGRGLLFLEELGLHEKTIGLYLKPDAFTEDQLDQMLLESSAANYITALFDKDRKPESPLASSRVPLDAILKTIIGHIASSPDNPHTPSLNIVRAMPTSLIVGTGLLRAIPVSPQEPYLHTLSILLQSKRLYAEYLSTHDEFYPKLIEYGSIPALGPVAVAALDVLEHIALETEWEKEDPIPGVAESGIVELSRAPGVMSFLITEPERFAGVGDHESWAWRVTRRRWMLVGEAAQRARAAGVRAWADALEKRYREGPWAPRRGAEVATEEA